MLRQLALCLTFVSLILSCRAHRPAGLATDLKDTSIVTSGPEDQRGTAFCWAYAIVAHLEQRYYEMTRSAAGGGFRLNFSEEYLGLIHLVGQLVNGQPVNEGLLLSESLTYVERYGIVPEKIGDQELFKAKFEESIGVEVLRAAQRHWQEAGLDPQSPLSPTLAVSLVAKAANLDERQTKFLGAAIQLGHADDPRYNELSSPDAAHFAYANGSYTPQSWAKNRLKFSAANYTVLRFPDPEDAEAYAASIKLVKKALLYGYSVPISFNLIERSSFKNGVLECEDQSCEDASLSRPSMSNPHANHAVLLIDYRTPFSTFSAPTAELIQKSYDTTPTDWVIKNSWGLNRGTSTDPELLRRFPLPAYSMMTNNFFQASHRLKPDRYEALLPVKVCLQGNCEATSSGTVRADVVATNFNSAAMSRYPVTFDAAAPNIGTTSNMLALIPTQRTPPDGRKQISLVTDTIAPSGLGEKFWVCTKVAVGAGVKYVAAYIDDSAGMKLPYAVLSEQGQWQHCSLTNRDARTIRIVLQALDARYRALGQLSASLQTQN